MKKFFSIILVTAIVLFFSACGGDDSDDNTAGAGGSIVSSGGTGGDASGGTGAGSGGNPPDTQMDSSVPDGNVTPGKTSGTTGGETGGTTGGETGGAAGSADGGTSGAPDDFQACVDSLEPVCDVTETDTLEKMLNAPACKAMKFIPIPLSDGGQYGPLTIESGPYGGTFLWNHGAGSGFENNVNPAEPICLVGGVQLFAEPESVNAEILNTRGIDYSLYTIFRPACMKEGEKYPVITWANGTCGITHGYVGLLSGVASHGFVVIASNSTWTMTTTAPDGTPVQRNAINYAEALNEDPNSIFYQKLDLEHIGASGHSQGSGATAVTASDPRVDAIIMWNGGPSNAKPFLNVSGDRDIGNPTSARLITETNGATQPGAWVFYHQVLETGGTSTGHLTLMEQPDRVVEIAVAWWKWRLKEDQEAKKMFIGDNCGLCNRDAEFEYGHNDLLQ